MLIEVDKLSYSAIIPAAGKGSRLAQLPFSKELLTVGYSLTGEKIKQPKTISSYLIDHYKRTGVREIHFIIREGKTDIAEYFKSGNKWGVDIAYHFTEVEFGVPFTIDKAYPFYKNKNILFGFPDILFYPDDAFSQMQAYLNENKETDIVLGLFPVREQQKWDTVILDENNRIKKIRVKEENDAMVKYAWINAAWRPVFSAFLHKNINKLKISPDKIKNELYMGHIIQLAIEEGLKVIGVPFDKGGCLDVGTPWGYFEAEEFFNKFIMM